MCGIVGVFNVPNAAELTALGLHTIQTRARDGCGIVSSDGSNLYRKAGPGLVADVFPQRELDLLHGRNTLGHIRYSTVDDNETRDNTQPIKGRMNGCEFALAHNGNITNVSELKAGALKGVTLATSMDTECAVKLLSRETECGVLFDQIDRALSHLEGSYTFGLLMHDRLIAVRDPHDNRPLVWGKLNDGYVIASETSALTGLGVYEHHEMERGAVMIFSGDGVETRQLSFAKGKPRRRCFFEHVYYANPASVVFDVPTATFRVELGKELGRTCPAKRVDKVVAIPDSSTPIGEGFAETDSSSAFDRYAILRNHHTGRTFILKSGLRMAELARKFIYDISRLHGLALALIDDSIVRLNTLRNINEKLREMGVKEIHARIACPPITHPCLYGIDTKTEKELVAAGGASVAEICQKAGVDSLEFLSEESLRDIIGKFADPNDYCYACITGGYWHNE